MRLSLFQDHSLERFQGFHHAFHEIVGAGHGAPNGLDGGSVFLDGLFHGAEFPGQRNLQAGGFPASVFGDLPGTERSRSRAMGTVPWMARTPPATP